MTYEEARSIVQARKLESSRSGRMTGPSVQKKRDRICGSSHLIPMRAVTSPTLSSVRLGDPVAQAMGMSYEESKRDRLGT